MKKKQFEELRNILMAGVSIQGLQLATMADQLPPSEGEILSDALIEILEKYKLIAIIKDS